MIEVINPGMHATLQDFGRLGWLRKGLTRGGPADEHAFLWANKLLGNRFSDAQLELTLGGAEIRFGERCSFAVTGAEAPLKLAGETISGWQSYTAEAGQALTIGHAQQGLRLYLAIAGGFQCQQHWGSVATVTREQVGGVNADGGAIQAGSQLPGGAVTTIDNQRVPWQYRRDYDKAPTLGLLPGNQYDEFPAHAVETFCFDEYRVHPSSNRMGVRLQGSPLAVPENTMVSEGINIGSVQVPPNGEPIIMLCDRQTLGGYPKLGTINPLDVARLAQCRPGDSVRFTRVTIETVQRQLAEYYRFFDVQFACQHDENLRS